MNFLPSKFVFLGLSLLFPRFVLSMEHVKKHSQLASIRILLGTSDKGNDNIVDADANHAIFSDFIELLLARNHKNSDVIFISYGLCTTLKKEYEKAVNYFTSLGIKDPLNQIAIQPVIKCSFFDNAKNLRLEKFGKELLPFTTIWQEDGFVKAYTRKVAIFKSPDTVFAQTNMPLDKNNCNEHVLRKE